MGKGNEIFSSSKTDKTENNEIQVNHGYKLFWVSDNPMLPTGYANVTRNVLTDLNRAGFNVATMGFQYGAMRADSFKVKNIPTQEYPLYPNSPGGNCYADAEKSVDNYIKMFNPEYVGFLCDMFMINWVINKKYPHTKKLMYFPYDSETIYEKSREVLESMDVRVAMSKFGQKLLKKETGLDSFYIPHGVDTRAFRPLPQHLRNILRKDNGLEGKFVVGCVSRNQSRKLITRMMEAYEKFARNKDDTVLLIHAAINDPSGNNLYELAKELNILNKIKFTGLASFVDGVSQGELNAIYNMMDVHGMATTGEGFGLTTIESMAAGVPNLCTNYTTAKELIGKSGELVDVQTYLRGQLNTKRALVDIDDYANKLEKLYNNPKLLEKYSKSGRKRIVKNYDWRVVNRKWIRLLEHGDTDEI